MLASAQQAALSAAIPYAQDCEHASGLWSSLTLAQWAVESDWGQRCPGNNPFGITWTPNHQEQLLWTHEEVPPAQLDGWKIQHPELIVEKTLPSGHLWVKLRRPFNAYATLGDAFEDHGRLLTQGHPYAAVWSAHCQDAAPFQFITAFAPIYATDHNYAATLTEVINAHNLTQYDHRWTDNA